MKKSNLNRRDFSKLTVAAFGGMMAGTLAGCGKKEEAAPSGGGAEGGTEGGAEAPAAEGPEMAVAEKHVCRGLNSCKGKGADGANECAGQGTCATVAESSCHGENECKGLGGCGESVAANECKGQGECAVPLKTDEAWAKARAAFEKKMADAGTTVGEAPAKPM